MKRRQQGFTVYSIRGDYYFIPYITAGANWLVDLAAKSKER
jgi:hypothetical protein